MVTFFNGKRVTEKREAFGLTLEELWSEIDVPVDELDKYERGIEAPTVEISKRISDVLIACERAAESSGSGTLQEE